MILTDYTGLADKAVVDFAADRLSINPDVELVVNHNERILDGFGSDDIHIDAILHRLPIPGKYQLVIRERPSEPIRRILLHEMVHLSQYEAGALSLDIVRRTFTWKGREYGPEIQYDRRPWEIEAFSMAGRLEKEWKTVQKPGKKTK